MEGTISNIKLGARTAEIVYPHGFVLMNCEWIIPSEYHNPSILISGHIDNSLLNKKVRAWGLIKTFKSGGMYGSWYLRLVADSLRLVN